MTTIDSRTAQANLAQGVSAHLERVSRTPRSTQQLLASAYAERLSLLRCDATDDELSESARVIARLETRYRSERSVRAAVVDVRDASDSAASSSLRLDPTVYLG